MFLAEQRKNIYKKIIDQYTKHEDINDKDNRTDKTTRHLKQKNRTEKINNDWLQSNYSGQTNDNNRYNHQNNRKQNISRKNIYEKDIKTLNETKDTYPYPLCKLDPKGDEWVYWRVNTSFLKYFFTT
jgi:hypothetical protein